MRVASRSDLDGLTSMLTAAFEHDPLWSWAFPDPNDLAVWWRFYIASALRYPGGWIGGDFAAASVWIPPDGTELADAAQSRVEPTLTEPAGPHAPGLLAPDAHFDA